MQLGVLLNKSEAKPATRILTKFRVFPDYSSTGIWDYYTGENVDPEDTPLTTSEIIALKMWHDVWEYCLYDETCRDDSFELVSRMSDTYIKKHSKALYNLFNAVNERLGYEAFVVEYNIYSGGNNARH